MGVITQAARIPLDVPIGWGGDEAPDVNMVEALLLLGGVPLLVILAITIAVYVPSLVRGEPITPGAPAVENQWLGGPRAGTAQLSAPGSADTETGGASGRW